MTRSGKTVGLVLKAAPRYTETFLINKIEGLIAAGVRVVLFTDQRPEVAHQYDEIVGHSLPSNPIWRALVTAWVLVVVTIRCPRRVIQFYKLERSSGASFAHFVKRVFISAHILPHRVDNLHFCFAALAVDRESLGKVMNAKISVSFRGYDISLYPLARLQVYSRLWKCVDKVHTISDVLYKKALDLGLPDTVPSMKITPAIDCERFLYYRDYRPASGPLRILTVGRLQWKKGIDVAIDAMAILRAKGVAFRYTIVGDGNDKERFVFARYQQGLEKDVIFTGKKDHKEVAEIMRESDIYIQPSLQEGFCNAVLEAQANGLLCIVSDAEGLPENVVHGVTGWVVPRADAESLADMIISASELSCSEKEQVGRAAAERVQREFSLEEQRCKFVRFFEN